MWTHFLITKVNVSTSHATPQKNICHSGFLIIVRRCQFGISRTILIGLNLFVNPTELFELVLTILLTIKHKAAWSFTNGFIAGFLFEFEEVSHQLTILQVDNASQMHAGIILLYFDYVYAYVNLLSQSCKPFIWMVLQNRLDWLKGWFKGEFPCKSCCLPTIF